MSQENVDVVRQAHEAFNRPGQTDEALEAVGLTR
jgi:hypothetical protein